MKDPKKILNDDIQATLVKLIDEQGEVLGLMTLSEAKLVAREREMDLMQLSHSGDVTVVKLLDYGKFLYKQKKQDQKNKQNTKTPDLKTIKITFKIEDHDLEIRRNQAEKFARDAHPLKVVLQLRGRENHYEALARQKMETFIASLEPFYKVDKKLVKNGNSFFVSFLPK